MKVELGVLTNSAVALGSLMRSKLRASVAFKIALLVKSVEAHLGVLNENLTVVLEKYGTYAPEKSVMGQKFYDIVPEKMSEYEAERKELLDVKVDVPDTQLSLFDIGDAEVSAADLIQLDWMIKLPTSEYEELEGDVVAEK